MGRYLRSRPTVRSSSWAILAQDWGEEASDFGQERKKSQRRTTQAAMNAPSASLRSENSEMKSAVEMTPRGKSGKLKDQKRLFHSYHRAWKSGKNQRRRIPTFPPRRQRLYILRKDKT